MQEWVLEDFSLGNGMDAKAIRFCISSRNYIMFFVRTDTMLDDHAIGEQSLELGVEIRSNSYNVKFDLEENFDNGNYYDQPNVYASVGHVRELGEVICSILEYHCRMTDAEAYYCVAESMKLKRFYDRLSVKHAARLGFTIINGLGTEELGYEIRTPHY